MNQTDFITAEELEAIGLTPAHIARWPVPEYTDSEGQAYWLWEDLALWLNWQKRVPEEVSDD